MANKVDDRVFDRIRYLLGQGLTQEVIGIRLGLSARTVRIYVRSIRTGEKPYAKSTTCTISESLNDV